MAFILSASPTSHGILAALSPSDQLFIMSDEKNLGVSQKLVSPSRSTSSCSSKQGSRQVTLELSLLFKCKIESQGFAGKGVSSLGRLHLSVLSSQRAIPCLHTWLHDGARFVFARVLRAAFGSSCCLLCLCSCVPTQAPAFPVPSRETESYQPEYPPQRGPGARPKCHLFCSRTLLFFLRDLFIFISCGRLFGLHVCLCTACAQRMQRLEDGIGSPGTGVVILVVSCHCGCWELSPGPQRA